MAGAIGMRLQNLQGVCSFLKACQKGPGSGSLSWEAALRQQHPLLAFHTHSDQSFLTFIEEKQHGFRTLG